jgi:hypothetical protein
VISHFSVIANVIQMAAHFRINDPLCKDKWMVPGDIAVAGKNSFRFSPIFSQLIIVCSPSILSYVYSSSKATSMELIDV